MFGNGIKEFVVVETQSPIYGGRSFGEVGQYESLSGYVVGAADPNDPKNAELVNLDKAPRNSDGLVEYKTDVTILQPVDPSKGNDWMFYEILNRGQKRAICRVNSGPAVNTADTAGDAGTGYLMNEGYTIVWTGWQDDVTRDAGRMRADYPVATNGSAPITGACLEEFISEANQASFVGALAYPIANLDEEAILTVRLRERDDRQTPAGLSWRYLDDRRVEITRPSGDAFDGGAIYEFIYTAKNPTVAGLAFASVRDIASFLRNKGADNPLAQYGTTPPQRAMLFGLSQSGRFVRDFLYQGFNEALAGGQVFQVAVPVIAGSRKTFINQAFTQAGRYQRQHEDHNYPGDQFPFTYRTLTDPISGLTDGLLERCEAAGVTPKIMHLDTDTEIWSARASLVVTDCEGQDIEQPDNVRVYLAAGTPHGWAVKPDASAIQQPDSEMTYSAVMRPLISAMKEWVENDVAPPPSCFPSVDAGTLVAPDQDSTGFPDIPGVVYSGLVNGLRLADHSVIPPREGASYPVMVSTVDSAGNGNAGLRHPALRAPRATLTGWNLRAKGHAEGDIYSTTGSKIPFAETRAERLAKGDPRPSIAERYKDDADYAAKLRTVVDDMVAERSLLAEDADRIVAAAQEGSNVLTAA